MVGMVDKDETIEVPSIGNRPSRIMGRQILCEIIEPRVDEVLTLARQELVKAGREASSNVRFSWVLSGRSGGRLGSGSGQRVSTRANPVGWQAWRQTVRLLVVRRLRPLMG